MRVTIIYWSGTGNTARMAEAIQQGAAEAGAETKLINLSEGVDEKDLLDADRIALGCPAMGAELAAYDNPDAEAIEKCIALGKQLAE